ncbi:MAG TPA: STAS domain-containing protein [Solirubrobacteraceae bacterium]|nr:STAS domain-containing protein [Solirubrobacteraceae bacterium]
MDSDNYSLTTLEIATRTLNSGRLLVAVAGELDLASARALSDTLTPELAAGKRVLLDLSGVTFIDSTGLAAIINAVNGADGANGSGPRLELSANLRPQARRLMELTGVLSMLPLVDGDSR